MNLSSNLNQSMQLNLAKNRGGRFAFVVKPIMPAAYFKRLCFVMLRNHLLVELVELKEER